MTSEERKVIIGSALGTLFEWYDFLIYGSVAGVIAKNFFSSVGPTYGYIFALLGFGAGFIIRPIGAIVFGRLGDKYGRKKTFLLTIILMGFATFCTGLLPTYRDVGMIAPALLITLRMVQGLALGGEYGGAVTYVAEHSPPDKRGLYTAWIQTTGTAGMVLALVVVTSSIHFSGDRFESWGWRLPFIVSIFMLLISLYIRLSLKESPVFLAMKASGRESKAPFWEAFGQWKHLRLILLAIFGMCAGQTVLYYTSAFFPIFFLTQALRVDPTTSNILVISALVLCCPFFVIFGWLSDRIGRKPVLLAGLIIPAATLFPIYKGIAEAANPSLAKALASAPVVLSADLSNCSLMLNPTGNKKFTSSCDVAKLALSRASVNFAMSDRPGSPNGTISVGDRSIESVNLAGMNEPMAKDKTRQLDESLKTELARAGYPQRTTTAEMNIPAVFGLLLVLAIYATVSYSVMGIILVEMFPARIRYTSLSVPYHISTGWFGGLQPSISFALIAERGNLYAGLWYPVAVAAVTIIIGAVWLKETRHNHIEI
nr:MFS transporter [Caballeronia sp. GAWG2-1]